MLTSATYITENLSYPMHTTVANLAIVKKYVVFTFAMSKILLVHPFFIMWNKNIVE